jgi:hypothetical protein
MDIEMLLDDSENSFLIITPGEVEDVAIGVPHHAPLGTTKLPCEQHRVADENAGYLGYYTARLLGCPSVIACNYFIDANKASDSDYFKKIQSLKPKMLIEIHGHAGISAKFDIEISSGSPERNRWSTELAERLGKKLSNAPLLQGYTLSGDFGAIHFQASKSASVISQEWIPFHIELPKSIRASRSTYFLFCELLAETIKGMLSDFNKLKKAFSTLET